MWSYQESQPATWIDIFHNLTQIADDPAKQRQFLADLAAFLGCTERQRA